MKTEILSHFHRKKTKTLRTDGGNISDHAPSDAISQAVIFLLTFFSMNGEVYGITSFPIREGKCQAFHSINEAVGDMVEHFADTFDSNATFLKGCIIKDGTSVILVAIHLMLLKNGIHGSFI